mmetsp:Transcript_77352/g.238769  ORF Transcript_77352/g.238769 Transcript_77352/m.238769 type:complete len:251 (+) Transcript_77352:2178-2930(+)
MEQLEPHGRATPGGGYCVLRRHVARLLLAAQPAVEGSPEPAVEGSAGLPLEGATVACQGRRRHFERGLRSDRGRRNQRRGCSSPGHVPARAGADPAPARGRPRRRRGGAAPPRLRAAGGLRSGGGRGPPRAHCRRAEVETSLVAPPGASPLRCGRLHTSQRLGPGGRGIYPRRLSRPWRPRPAGSGRHSPRRAAARARTARRSAGAAALPGRAPGLLRRRRGVIPPVPLRTGQCRSDSSSGTSRRSGSVT